MQSNELLVERRGGQLWLRINRPTARNAINWNVRRSLQAELRMASADPTVRVVVLAGTAVAFCSGGDIKEMGGGPEDSAAKLEIADEIITLISEMTKPVVAAVRGHVAGAGIGLALACDIVYASTTALISPAFVLRGLGPDMSTSYWLTKSLGVHRAKNLLLTAQPVDAQRAFELGLFSEVSDDDSFEEFVGERVAELENGATVAMGQIKRLVNAAVNNSLNDQMKLEAEAMSKVVLTEDHRNAIRAFTEKRQPSFEGR